LNTFPESRNSISNHVLRVNLKEATEFLTSVRRPSISKPTLSHDSVGRDETHFSRDALRVSVFVVFFIVNKIYLHHLNHLCIILMEPIIFKRSAMEGILFPWI